MARDKRKNVSTCYRIFRICERVGRIQGWWSAQRETFKVCRTRMQARNYAKEQRNKTRKSDFDIKANPPTEYESILERNMNCAWSFLTRDSCSSLTLGWTAEGTEWWEARRLTPFLFLFLFFFFFFFFSSFFSMVVVVVVRRVWRDEAQTVNWKKYFQYRMSTP